MKNNPLSATDPTGYFSFSKFMHKWMPIILQIGMMAASGGLTAWGPAAVAGFMGFAMSGGDVRAGLVAAATAGMFHAVGTAFGPAPQNYLLSGYHMGKILAHGIVGGISSKLGGGNFADGFRSAAVTQAFAPGIDEIYKDNSGVAAKASRITVAAIVGGTASAAGGGKFANGAVTGAFSRAFNHEAHLTQPKTHVLLGYSKVGEVNGDTFYHSYVKVVGPNGETYFIRGGPGAQGSDLKALASDISGMTSVSNGGLGRLTVSFGAEAQRIETYKPTFMMTSEDTWISPFQRSLIS